MKRFFGVVLAVLLSCGVATANMQFGGGWGYSGLLGGDGDLQDTGTVMTFLRYETPLTDDGEWANNWLVVGVPLSDGAGLISGLFAQWGRRAGDSDVFIHIGPQFEVVSGEVFGGGGTGLFGGLRIGVWAPFPAGDQNHLPLEFGCSLAEHLAGNGDGYTHLEVFVAFSPDLLGD